MALSNPYVDAMNDRLDASDIARAANQYDRLTGSKAKAHAEALKWNKYLDSRTQAMDRLHADALKLDGQRQRERTKRQPKRTFGWAPKWLKDGLRFVDRFLFFFNFEEKFSESDIWWKLVAFGFAFGFLCGPFIMVFLWSLFVGY